VKRKIIGQVGKKWCKKDKTLHKKFRGCKKANIWSFFKKILLVKIKYRKNFTIKNFSHAFLLFKLLNLYTHKNKNTLILTKNSSNRFPIMHKYTNLERGLRFLAQ